jgi:hypothetical protein
MHCHFLSYTGHTYNGLNKQWKCTAIVLVITTTLTIIWINIQMVLLLFSYTDHTYIDLNKQTTLTIVLINYKNVLFLLSYTDQTYTYLNNKLKGSYCLRYTDHTYNNMNKQLKGSVVVLVIPNTKGTIIVLVIPTRLTIIWIDNENVLLLSLSYQLHLQ